MKQYFIPILMGLAMGCTTPNIYGPSKEEQDLAKLLDSTPIQAADFVKAPIKDIVSYLSSQSALHSPNNKSVTFVFPYDEDLQKIVTARLTNSSLSDAIRTLCGTNALRYRLDGTAVYISGFYDEPGPLSMRSYKFPRHLFHKHFGDNPSSEQLNAQLYKYGLRFPAGAVASYNNETQIMTILDTQEYLDVAGAIFLQLKKEEASSH